MPVIDEQYMRGRIHAPPGRDFSTTRLYSFHHIVGDGYTINLQVIGRDENLLYIDWEGIVNWEYNGEWDVLRIIQASMIDPPPPPPRAPAGMTERHPNKENYYSCGDASGPGPSCVGVRRPGGMYCVMPFFAPNTQM
ncbi:hypothetical protein BD410DRAFT_828367 [Rickenella mellea]|uniref:Uncharacterized protein n=1 Tax=Rickenella mellea TaxID=50990 RepID=A0A4Y7Q5C6_9AGAM|nr:hypothetical protein BD410DRAFT_828367 [Rickenella mellea]